MVVRNALALFGFLLSIPWEGVIAKICKTEVVIVGAGMSGLSAGKTLKAKGVNDFVIVESTDRIGGRVKSKKDFGVNKDTTVEVCANWVYDFKWNNFFNYLQQKNLTITINDFFDFKAYEYRGDISNPSSPYYGARLIPEAKVTRRRKNFLKKYKCMNRKAKPQYSKSGVFLDESIGGQELLQDQCGWKPTFNMDYAFEWLYFNFEYAEEDIAALQLPEDVYNWKTYMVVDQEGFEKIPQAYADDFSLLPHIEMGRRVTRIKYNVANQGDYHALVNVNGSGSCTKYRAKYVIVTVPVGVLNNNKIKFVPALSYPPNTYNPLKMKDYIKVFYQFSDTFWDDNEFLMSLKRRRKTNEGKCHHWQNMEATIKGDPQKGTSTQFIPGKNILMCTLTTEGFRKLLSETGKNKLTKNQLEKELLEPLRRIYGSKVDKKLVDYWYPELNLDEDSGFGSFSNWQVGYSEDDYFKFFGGGLAEYCHHNGCNKAPTDPDAKWVVHIGGTGSCFDHWEYVHGAVFAGDRSAKYVLDLMGKKVSTEAWRCEDSLYYMKQRMGIL